MAEEIFSDSEIGNLISIEKRLSSDWQSGQVGNIGHLQSQVDLYGTDGTPLRIIARQSVQNRNNFSIILAVETTHGRYINLLRYDGGNHPHRNKIEGTRIMYKPHIHRATERYQRLRRADPEGYAEETDRYHDINGAWECFRADTNLQPLEGGTEMNLPEPFMEV